MRLREILSEAGKNLSTGTARAIPHALALAVLLIIALGIDQWTVAATRIDHAEFRRDGGTLWSISAPGGIDPGRCEGLATLSGVEGAGAIRIAESTRLRLVPTTPTRLLEATPGMARVLGVEETGLQGVWLSPSLATTLGAARGSEIEFVDGTTAGIAARYSFPSNVTGAALSAAIVAPAPVSGAWDECWIDLGRYTEAATTALHYSVMADASGTPGTQARVSQLNSARGRSHNLEEILEARTTRYLLIAAPVVGAGLAALAIRRRRLEHAAARQVGVTRADLAAITALETAAWAITGALLAVGVVGLLHVALMNGAGIDPRLHLPGALLAAGGLAAISAVSAVVVAALVSLTNKPRHLYRYFRERM
ncbi:MAG: hypothetical protein Q4G64_06440 [bacterium]|nr:hypothetical protein [bacterium]